MKHCTICSDDAHLLQRLSFSICSLLFVILQCNSCFVVPWIDWEHQRILVMWKWCWNCWLFKGIVYLAESLGVANRSSWQETVWDSFLETGLIGIAISFDVMSCNGISRGEICSFVEDSAVRQWQRQLQSNQRHN